MPIVDLKCPYCGHLNPTLDPLEDESIECSACEEFFSMLECEDEEETEDED